MSALLVWLVTNYIEIIGTITGILYIFLSINQSIWLWPVGILTSVFQMLVFYKSGIYADMGLQGYYVIVSIYGWLFWSLHKQVGNHKTDKKLPVIKLNFNYYLILIISTIIIFFIIKYILSNYTDSIIPNLDSFTTSLSITGTWLLARKYIENWYAWIIVDLVSSGLYLYKGLYFMSGLYAFLTIMAIIGLKKWKKDTGKNIKTIVITGSESTGKTTLTSDLADYYKTSYVDEYARNFVEKMNRPYNYYDIEYIARQQMQAVDLKKKEADKYLFVDTYLIIIKIWFIVKYKKYPVWIDREIKLNKIDLYLVCDTDIPWIEDPVRENGGEARLNLHQLYINELINNDLPYKVVRGLGKDRLNNAINIINTLS